MGTSSGRGLRGIGRRAVRWATAALVLTAGSLAGLPAAQADTAPPSGTPATVTADVLPTVQVNGVVWSQVVVGNKVYVGGSFTKARPAGAAVGTSEVARSNMLAYDIRTGVLDTTFKPTVNGQVLAVTASPDGSRIYIGGSFTKVNTSTRSRVAALSPSTGAPISSFAPVASTTVRAVHATSSTVYLGGDFTTMSSKARRYAASVSASSGAVTTWNPSPDAPVLAMTLNHAKTKLIMGGRFTTAGGRTNIKGLVAVGPTSGTSVTWAAPNTIRDAGTSAAITSLTADADGVYGSGYVFSKLAGNLEGSFMADNESGSIIWMEDCHGDTYSVFPRSGVVYAAGHSHYCGNVVDGFMQTNPWTYYHSPAFTKAVAGTLGKEYLGYTNWEGRPSPRLLHFFPNWNVGTVTGQGQATWSVSGNNDYIVYGGEFPKVNGVAQQGLVRFARPGLAPKKNIPNGNTGLTPSVTSYQSGAVRIGWLATYDRDNASLTYKVYRDFKALTDTPIHTTTLSSRFDKRQPMSFVDTGAAAGTSHNYRVYAFDPDGNSVSRAATTITVASSTETSYRAAVLDGSPSAYYRLADAVGATTAMDSASADNLVPAAGVAFGVAGAVGGDTAASFNGTTTGFAASQISRPAPNTFSVEAWFRTTTTTGGKIVGYGDKAIDNSSSYDRHVYMDNAGHLVFGVNPSSPVTMVTPGTYNDGAWHQVVATLGSSGMRLYVDGAQAAARTDVTSGQKYSGVWRIGGDNLAGWGSKPSSYYLNGRIDEVSITGSVLSAAQVADRFQRGTQAGVAVAAAGAPKAAPTQEPASAGPTGPAPAEAPATPADVVPADEVPADVTPADAAPTALLSATTQGLQVSVDGTASTDREGVIAGYSWDFGDGSAPTSAALASHVYAAPGTYVVTLTVTDSLGHLGSASAQVSVVGEPIAAAPGTPIG